MSNMLRFRLFKGVFEMFCVGGISPELLRFWLSELR